MSRAPSTRPAWRGSSSSSSAPGVDGLTILGFLGEAGKLIGVRSARSSSTSASPPRTAVYRSSSAPPRPPRTRASPSPVMPSSRGAAGLLVAPPRLARPNEAAVRRHYESAGGRGRGAHRGPGLPRWVGRVHEPRPSSAGWPPTSPPAAGSSWRTTPPPRRSRAILEANPDIGIFGGLGGNFMLEELQRGAVGMMTGFGFPRSSSRSTVTSAPVRPTRRATPSIATCRSSATRTRPG